MTDCKANFQGYNLNNIKKIKTKSECATLMGYTYIFIHTKATLSQGKGFIIENSRETMYNTVTMDDHLSKTLEMFCLFPYCNDSGTLLSSKTIELNTTT